MMPVPIIKLEVEQMRYTIATALTEYTMQMDKMIQDALNKYCTEENLSKIINEEAIKAIDVVVRDAVRNWFLYSENGKEIIKSEIASKLEEEAKYYRRSRKQRNQP